MAQHNPVQPRTVHWVLCAQLCCPDRHLRSPPACPCSPVERPCSHRPCPSPQSLATMSMPGPAAAPRLAGLPVWVTGPQGGCREAPLVPTLLEVSGSVPRQQEVLWCRCRALCGGSEHSALFADGLRLLSTSRERHLRQRLGSRQKLVPVSGTQLPVHGWVRWQPPAPPGRMQPLPLSPALLVLPLFRHHPTSPGHCASQCLSWFDNSGCSR